MTCPQTSQLCDVLAGVKLVLPAILTGVDDSAWRTKQGSIELLGTMAYLAPKQLSTSLPTVVPILGKTLSDPHPKVQASAKKALEEVCLCSTYLPAMQLLTRGDIKCMHFWLVRHHNLAGLTGHDGTVSLQGHPICAPVSA